MSASILWHDYETWGVDPKRDFPVQFAAIRTDLSLNIIDKPINYFCQIPNDYLPHPQACLVTGITPQQSLSKGYAEYEFANKVLSHLQVGETCSAGYNSIKFDEEVTRNLLYRNFYSVYEREYEQGNSRWDIIDLVRAAYALRPEGINWPYYDDGKPCFKLEALTKANDLEHASAHDALSDVYATIAIAKLIKDKQPKLYDFYWHLRNKQNVLNEIDVVQRKPFLHISGYVASEHGCCAWLMPICQHPTNKNVIIAVNLSKDIGIFTSLRSDELGDPELISQLYRNKQVPIMQISVNKVPFVAPGKTLTEDNAKRLGIDREQCLNNYHALQQLPNLAEMCSSLCTRDYSTDEPIDIDAQLYTRDFPSAADKQLMNQIRNSSADNLSNIYTQLSPSPYRQQLFRYMGRNFPQWMDEKHLENWQVHRKERFVHGTDKAYLTLTTFQQQIELLVQQHKQDNNKMYVLRELERYASQL
jgi:exodeoxyribonuclease-1